MNSAVTLIFFTRSDTLEKVFEKIRIAKPPKLFLVQDGPRKGNEMDEKKIMECRSIVEKIDWDCDVYKNYADVNLGCGERPQSGITWALSHVDSTIILEDDCVPDLSFFEYCDQMLDKYKDDERICYISGLNHFEEWDFGGSSYGFTKGGAIWGWATWKRAWKAYDYSVSQINNFYIERLTRRILNKDSARVDLWKKTNNTVKKDIKISYWDIQWGFVKYSQNQLVIVPKYNLIHNIGVGNTSTHAKQNFLKHKKYRDFYFMPVRSLEFPLIHPQHMICDIEYDELLIQCNKRSKRRMWFEIIKNKLIKR